MSRPEPERETRFLVCKAGVVAPPCRALGQPQAGHRATPGNRRRNARPARRWGHHEQLPRVQAGRAEEGNERGTRKNKEHGER